MNENKIFVGGLSWLTTSERLNAYFSAFGEVTDLVVMMNQETGKSRGFAFVTFKDSASVQSVLSKSQRQLDGRNIDPKECNLRNGVKTKKDTNFCKIFVGGLPHDIKEDVLRDFFSKYGTVTEVVIMYDQEKRKTRGFGFVSFDKEDTVNKLVEERFLTINGKKIEIKKAEPQRQLRSNSSSMTNISMQSSHNGYLSGLSPYVSQITAQPATHHQLHAVHTIMQPPPQETSFQFAYHPNSYSTMPHQLHHTARQEVPQMIAGYASTSASIQAPSHHQLVSSHQIMSSQPPWPLTHHPVTNQLAHLHTIPHHSMQTTSPNPSLITAHPQSTAILQPPQSTQPIVQQQQQQTGSSRPNTPSSTPNSGILQPPTPQPLSSTSNQTNNVNLVQSQQQLQHPQPSLTPTALHHAQATASWYNPHQASLIANPALQPTQTVNPAFSQAITFGYPTTGYLPAGTAVSPAHWPPHHQNPYLYGAYPLTYQPTVATAQALPTSSPPAIHSSQSITPQGTYK